MTLIIAGPAEMQRTSGQVKVHIEAKALQADCCMNRIVYCNLALPYKMLCQNKDPWPDSCA